MFIVQTSLKMKSLQVTGKKAESGFSLNAKKNARTRAIV